MALVLAGLAALLAVALVVLVPSPGGVGGHAHGYRPERPPTAHQFDNCPNGAPILPAGGYGPAVACGGPTVLVAVVAALHSVAPVCEGQGQGASAWAEQNTDQPGGYEVLARCEGHAPTTTTMGVAR